MNDRANRTAPILAGKLYNTPSAFTPENLLREARRQKGIEAASVPAVCVLDPDGDMVRRLRREGRAQLDSGWACYHTELYRTLQGNIELGLVGCAVGAPFAVLVAEELFASGCKLLISVTSAGQLAGLRPPPYFVLIDKALRDEGTSYHYLASDEFSRADESLLRLLMGPFWICRYRSSGAQPGPLMRRFVRHPAPSPKCGRGGCWPSKWRLPRSTPLPRRAASRSSALPMSPIRWRASSGISRKATPKARSNPWP